MNAHPNDGIDARRARDASPDATLSEFSRGAGRLRQRGMGGPAMQV